MRKFLFAALLMATSAAAFTAGQQSTAIDSLNAFNDRFNQSAAKGDADDLVAMYDDNPIWIEQANPAVKGLEHPRKLFDFVTSNNGEVTHTVDNLFVADDASLAVMIGSVEAKVEKVGMDATGTYLFVLRPYGKSWKITTDMWHQHVKPKAAVTE